MNVAEKRAFFLKRLHSLTGLALCGFILEHIFTNSASIHALFGDPATAAATFNSHVDFLHSIPALPLLEAGLLAAPFLFHTLFGFILTFRGSVNLANYPYERNFMYVMQRVSAVIIALFLTVHVLELRFGVNVMPRASGFEVTHSTNHTAHRYSETIQRHIVDLPTARPDTGEVVDKADYWSHVEEYFDRLPTWGIWLYITGILATAFHFGNGLFLAGITWGVWVRHKSQGMAFLACMGLAALLGAAGVLSIFGFGATLGA
jgi:succinate dehydrogenase / fumarate reductase, cytochrome b subunit